MSNTWYDYTNSTASTSANSNDFYNKYYRETSQNIIRSYEKPSKIPKMDLRFDVDDGFTFKELKIKKPEPPQTVFHFDPKGIVDKWPEDVI